MPAHKASATERKEKPLTLVGVELAQGFSVVHLLYSFQLQGSHRCQSFLELGILKYSSTNNSGPLYMSKLDNMYSLVLISKHFEQR